MSRSASGDVQPSDTRDPGGGVGPADVADVLDARGTSEGAVIDGLSLVAGAPGVISGVARVAEAVDDDAPGIPGLGELVDGVEAGDILVIGWRARECVAVFGCNAGLAASMRGCRGVVVDGWVRDTPDMALTGLSVWARGITPRGGRGKLALVRQRPSVEVSGVTVHDGDLVIADVTGVAVVREGSIAEVMEEAKERSTIDARVRAAITQGASFGHAVSATW